MQIQLHDIAKRYHRWIFREINYTFGGKKAYGIAGHNGSGKSTLLSIIAGFTTPTRGEVSYQGDQGPLNQEVVFNYINIAAPYISLIGELTLSEHLAFHTKFKPFIHEFVADTFFERSHLKPYQNILVEHLSSGLQQRFKLALSLFTQCDVLLLDEPTSYLDQSTQSWFKDLLRESSAKMIIMASNDTKDLDLMDTILAMENYQA